MVDDRDPLAAFDTDVLSAVAAENGLDEGALESLVRRHQEGVRDLPGVEDIVYEWRSQFHRDPLRDRTPERYVLVLRDHVWAEFSDSLGLSATELDALRAVHERQAKTVLDEGSVSDGAAMVLTRP